MRYYSKMKQRNTIIDLWRFIAAVAIMLHHVSELGTEKSICSNGYLFVEFFFMLSGFFTYSHFRNKETSANIKVDVTSFWYVFRKFKSYLPYTIPAILVQYIIESMHALEGGIKSFIGCYETMPIEMLFLLDRPHVGPLWFLNAMLIALPAVIIFIQIKNKYVVCMGSFLIGYCYYNYNGYYAMDIYYTDRLNCFIRALAGMMIGVFIATFIEILKEKKINWNRSVITVIETGCIVLSTLICIFDLSFTPTFLLYLFVIGLIIALSGESYTSKIRSKTISFLGKLATPIFIWEVVVINIENWIGFVFSERYGVDMINTDIKKILIYFIATFTIAVASYICVNVVRRNGIKEVA